MDEELEALEEIQAEAPPAEAVEAGGRRPRRGAGLLLGLLVGVIAGAIIARLLTPKEGEVVAVPPPEAVPRGDPAARVAAVLASVRARMQDASREAQEAVQETEERLRHRYSQLTSGDGL
jgi:tetrahydromethanopterin S-methyltransferase subunit G